MQDGVAGLAASAERVTGRWSLRANLATGIFWLLGSAIVAMAQPGTDRKLAAFATAGVAIAVLLLVAALTENPRHRYARCLVAGVITVPVASTWLLNHLVSNQGVFQIGGLETRIGLPLMFVLFVPLLVREIPRELIVTPLALLRRAGAMDWVMLSYAALILPGLALGFAHHSYKTYIAQDLGQVVFFVFIYAAGRAVTAQAARVSAGALTDLLLLLAIGNTILLRGVTPPLYTFLGGACAAAAGYLLLRPRDVPLLRVGLAAVVLAAQAVAVRNGTSSSVTVELAGAIAVIAYLLVRIRPVVPRWLIVGLALVALLVFVGFTGDGRTLQGRYYGANPSNDARTYEAQQARSEVTQSPVSVVLGRGFGATYDATHASLLFRQTLLGGGRDLAHVPEIHLVAYDFLLKLGLAGLAWLAAFLVGLAILVLHGLEIAVRKREPSLVLYAALPLLGVAAASAAAPHLLVNPLIPFALGVLVTRFGGKAFTGLRPKVFIPGAAVVCIALVAIVFEGTIRVLPGYTAPPKAVPYESVVVGDLRFLYPETFHRRYFTSSNPAVTGARGSRAQGVVVASFPLKRSPEIGAAGQVLRQNGLFFELYELSRGKRRLAPRKTFPLSIFDLPNVPALASTQTTEQGGLLFSVHGRNYRVILWLGKKAPQGDLYTVDDIMASLGVYHPKTG